MTVAPPQPLLGHTAERALGPRKTAILDDLEALILRHGFAAFTVAELARRLSCSRRTLYELAPSKHQLVLLVLDRYLQRIGRAAQRAIETENATADKIRAYVIGGLPLMEHTHQFATDLADDPEARRLLDRHFQYVTAVIEQLVAAGVASGELRSVNPTVVAGAIVGSGLYLTQPEVVHRIGDRTSVVDESLDFLLGGLAADAGR